MEKELTAEEILALQKELEDVKAENDLLKEENENLKSEVAELKEELVLQKDKVPAEKEQFEFNGKTYEVLVADAVIPGISDKKLTALEIANSDEAKEKLVTSNSGLIRELK